MKTISEYNSLIARDWAKTFNCPVEEFTVPGTLIQEKENLRGEKTVTIWHCGQKTIVRIDPDLQERISEFVSKAPRNLTLTGEYFADYFGSADFGCENVDHLFYLYPQKFKPFTAAKPFLTRKLTLADQAAFAEFSSHCSAADRERGYVELDHEIVAGVFKDDQLVAAASVLDWDVFYDVGILTHPDWRGAGLGKAAVSCLAEEIFKTDKIPLYRCQINLFPSRGIALALGFEENRSFVYKQECYKFRKSE